MIKTELIPVALDVNLVQQLLNGLYKGAAGKSLKVIIATDGSYHITSKELRMRLQIDRSGKPVEIYVSNDKLCAVVTAEELDSMKLTGLAAQVAKELHDKYSPLFHSLADNIIVFGRSYGGQ